MPKAFAATESKRRAPAPLFRSVALLGLFGVLGCVLLLAGGPILTDDLWWHLAMGEAYATGGPWLDSDPLLHNARAGGPVQHEWLFGVILYAIEGVAGFSGIRALHALSAIGIAALAYGVFQREASGRAGAGDASATSGASLASLCTSVFLILAWWRLMQARPDLATIAATLVFYRLLFEGESVPSWGRVGAMALLAGLWANVHSLFAILFPLGAAGVLGLVVRDYAARRLTKNAPEALPTDDGLRAKRVGLALAVSLLVSLLNPRGWAQHLTFFSSSRDAAIWQVRDEWRAFNPLKYEAGQPSLGFFEWGVAEVLLLSFAITAVVATVRFLNQPDAQRLRAADPLLYAIGFAAVIAMLTSVRFLWLGIFPLLALLRTARASGLGATAAGAAAATLVLAIVFPQSESWQRVRSTQPSGVGDYLTTSYLGHKFGVPGVRFLRESGIEGNLFNSYGAGGFFGYWLSPELRTFIDGRTEHYAPEVLEDYLAIVRRDPKNAALVEARLLARGVDVFFGFGFPNQSAREGLDYTAGHLLGEAGWVPVSRSTLHTIWLRANDRENLARAVAYYEARDVPFDPLRGFDAERILTARADWAVDADLVPASYPTLRSAYQDGTATREELDRLAVALALVGAHESQLDVERANEAKYGRTPGTLRRSAFAMLRLRRYAEADRAARQLVALAPDDPATLAVAHVAERFSFYRRLTQLQPSAPAPWSLMDTYPLLSVQEQQWILDSQRRLAVADRGQTRRASR